MGKIPNFAGHKDLEDLDSLAQNGHPPASPGPDSEPDASERSFPGSRDRRIKGRPYLAVGLGAKVKDESFSVGIEDCFSCNLEGESNGIYLYYV